MRAPRPLLAALLFALALAPGCSSSSDTEQPAPSETPTPASTSDEAALRAALQRISAWFATNATEGAPELAPPASEAELAAAEKTLGQALPPDVRALYRVANGSKQTPVVYGYSLLSLAELLDERALWEGLEDSAWERGQGWLPLTGNGGGDHHVRGPKGTVFAFSHEVGREEPSDPSLRAWLERFARELEAGRWAWSREDGQVVPAK